MVDHLFRKHAGQMVAYLARLLGPEHLELAEEVVQEALLKALKHWPDTGVPENPGGWLFRVARNAALDAVRRRSVAEEKEAALAAEIMRDSQRSHFPDPHLEEQLRDDELRMVLMCCHPALSQDARVALSLKTVGGFSVGEIARAFLTDEPAIAQRLVRAKRQVRELRLRLELPPRASLLPRLDSLLETLYLMFNEGYAAGSGDELVRHDLCGEALRLGRLVAASSVSTPAVHALVALMAFQAGRLPARVDISGELVLLEDQDRGSWDRRLIALGFHHFGLCSEGEQVSEYHAQAAIAAAHAGAPSGEETDWRAILSLYDQLLQMKPSPVVALNRAVALAKVEGAAAGLDAVEALTNDHALRSYYLLPAVQAGLLLELSRRGEAAACFREALMRPCSEPERRFLQRRLRECG
jgi:RNA polymerase sigma-70 factor (ECF subfamily)